ncbi:MAG: hypothetical protein RDU30_11785 [Desulfovibrionaceae bacterium]|nr:hypothetical protein [Desulfovibrionaceae bacterium]
MPTSRAGSSNRYGPVGFTLAEILVVLLIVSALAVLVLPGITPLLGGEDFRTAAGRLAEAFSRARLDAVVDGTRRRVVLDLDEGRFWVDHVPRADSGTGAVSVQDAREQDPSLPPPVKRSLPDGLRLVEVTVFDGDPVTSGRVSVRVLPLGLSEPCSVVLADKGETERRLDVPATGAPSWREAAGDATVVRAGP